MFNTNQTRRFFFLSDHVTSPSCRRRHTTHHTYIRLTTRVHSQRLPTLIWSRLRYLYRYLHKEGFESHRFLIRWRVCVVASEFKQTPHPRPRPRPQQHTTTLVIPLIPTVLFFHPQYLSSKSFISVDWKRISGKYDNVFGSKTTAGESPRPPTAQGLYSRFVSTWNLDPRSIRYCSYLDAEIVILSTRITTRSIS